MTNRTSLLAGIGIGAGLEYILDPIQGTRRRAVARDRAVRFARRGRQFVVGAMKDGANRVRGGRARWQPEDVRADDLADDTLVTRIRSAIGRATSHPGAVHVMCEDGVVRLDGAVLTTDADRLLSAVRKVDGIIAIDNRMRVCRTGEGVPGLQGSGRRPAIGRGWSWRSPIMRLTMATLGLASAAAVAYSATRAAPPAYAASHTPWRGPAPAED